MCFIKAMLQNFPPYRFSDRSFIGFRSKDELTGFRESAMMYLTKRKMMYSGVAYGDSKSLRMQDSVEGFFCNPLGYKYFMNVTFAE